MKRSTGYIIALMLIVSSQSVYSAVMIWKNDTPWRETWPQELKSFRELIVAQIGFQGNVFDIAFTDQEQFEKAWPLILKTKSYKAPLILENELKLIGSVKGSTSKMAAGVRILWTASSECQVRGGRMLKAYAPWPDSIRSPSGELPEYVVPTKETWVPYKDADEKTLRYRARVDIVLVVDGRVVDLNRISLPKDTPIIDRRFDELATQTEQKDSIDAASHRD